VLASALNASTVRFVTHHDVDRAACVKAAEVVVQVAAQILQPA